jgi:tetratricopeptide (TPR) repeat protein
MKLRNIIIGALMTVIAAPVLAQDNQSDQIMQQVVAILKSGSADAQKQIADIAKTYKKDVNGLVSIGRAYLSVKDYTKAKEYGQKAIDLLKGKQGNATPYLLMGNIAVGEDNGGEAASQFQQAMYADPKNPDGYRRYARIMSKTSPQDAVNTLEALKRELPNYPVDLIAAEIYSDAGNMKMAIEYYNKVSVNDMKDYQLSDYATNVFLSQDYQKSLSLAKQGHAKFPRNASFNRLIMFNNTELKNYDDALVGANDLFNNSDSLKASAFDYGYYARALKGADKYSEAIEQYQKLQTLDNVDDATKAQANKDISDCYKKLSDYVKAGEFLDKYVKAQPQQSFTLQETVASLYADQLADENTPAADKQKAYEMADKIYAELAEKYPTNAAYVANKRATLPFSLPIDQKEQVKLAGPHYVTFADILGAKTDRSAGENKMLASAYATLLFYYVNCVDDMEKGKEVAAKLLELDPENEGAKAVMGL